MSQLQRLKIKLSITDDAQDVLLEEFLTYARDYILAYTRRSDEQWLPIFNYAQLQIAAIEYGRLGAEGVQSRTEGGISTSFYGAGQDYPDSVQKTLNNYRLIKGL